MVVFSAEYWTGRSCFDPSNSSIIVDRCPDWLNPAPFRAHLRHLICETGLTWRLIAAHADVASRAVHALLHGRRGGSVRRVHVSVARALVATSVESIAAAETDHADAHLPRQLVQGLLQLNHSEDLLRRFLTDDDLTQLTNPTIAYCLTATAVRAKACYDLLTSPASGRLHVTSPPADRSNVRSVNIHSGLDRKQAAEVSWRTRSSSSIAAANKPC